MPEEFDLSGSFEGGFDADPAPPPPPQPQAKIQELSDVQQAHGSGFEVTEHRERTRGKFALYYIVGFMIIVVLAMLVSFYLLANDKLAFDDVTNILVTISGILSGPLGFIIGYYFKAESND